jgi:His-Xaa-Ser system protein HxsD
MSRIEDRGPQPINAPKITIGFDTRVFALEVVKKAAYKYLDTFSADFELNGPLLNCALSFNESVSDEAAMKLADEFKKEVLDQDLRERIKAETAPIRNLILAHAFSRTGLIVDDQVSNR